MSDSGATRGLLGSYSFILVMLGLEMWTSEHATQFGLGLFLLVVGGLLAYAAFFWETAKKVLSIEAQTAIGHFAQSRATWAFVIFLVLQAFIAAPFIEQHRWPFSYPIDPSMMAENAKLKNQITEKSNAIIPEKELADKWRFASLLRSSTSGTCTYQLVFSPRDEPIQWFWQQLLIAGGWTGSASKDFREMQPGIALRINSEASSCAAGLQRALSDIYPNPPSKIAVNQQSPFLGTCKGDCVQVELNY